MSARQDLKIYVESGNFRQDLDRSGKAPQEVIDLAVHIIRNYCTDRKRKKLVKKPGFPGVLDILTPLVEDEDDNDYVDLETVSLTWPEATRLTNLDMGGYIQVHWFGRLTNLEGLKTADSKSLYKGGIRKFGEELFSYGTKDEEEGEEGEREGGEDRGEKEGQEGKQEETEL